MAEVVSVLIDKLSDLLIQKTVQKIVFIKNVPVKVEELKTLLIDMHCFLKSADEMQDDDLRIRNWVSKIRVVAYDAEDLIETFIVKIQSVKKKGLLNRLVYLPKRVLCLNKAGKDIESILARIVEINKSRENFGVKNLGEGRSTRREELEEFRKSIPSAAETDLVGLDAKIDSVVDRLLVKDKSRRVISIVGMPGVGKTILARKVYERVSSQFGCSAWVYISHKCNFREILGEIIKQVEKVTNELLSKLEKMDRTDMQRMLLQILQEKQYLIVLDDIWEESAWDCLAGAFPDAGNGSRLMLTSRYRTVAQYADALSAPYELKTLDPNDSWQLFLKKACSDSVNPSCLPNLVSIGRKIVERCDGLPLAISVVGCLMRRTRYSESEWQRVLDTLSTYWSSNQISGVSAILELSYYNLPLDLKPCFLYFALFPEDFEIPTRKLFQLWIAEGLIRQKGSENLEDVAANHLGELIERNLVQVVAVKADETVKSCRLHDLLRDLAIRKAREEILLEIQGLSESQPSDTCRHLAIHCPSDSGSYTGHSTFHLRSLVFFNQGETETEISLDFTSFKLLRVLDLENSGLTFLPEEISELNLLRYLSLRNSRITTLPISVGCLQRLQTLDIYTENVEMEVPNTLWKLENLRHLYMHLRQWNQLLKFEKQSALQTLSYLHARALMPGSLITLTSLRKLGVYVDDSPDMDEFYSEMAELGNLRSLCLFLESHQVSLVALCNLSKLTKLALHQRLRKLPSPDHFPPNLSHLSLVHTLLDEDPMPVLEKLPLLSVLKLNLAFRGRQMKVSDNAFPQLRYLELGYMMTDNLDIGDNAMPDLRCLRIIHCCYLTFNPKRLKSMTLLRELQITGLTKMPYFLMKRLAQSMLSHVPTIILNEQSDTKEQRSEAIAHKAGVLFASSAPL